MISIEEACRMTMVCGASVILALTWSLIKRLASVHICYVTAQVRHLKVLTRAARSMGSCIDNKAGSALGFSNAVSLEDSSLAEPINSQSIMNFYSHYGRKLNPTEVESLVQFERYRRDYSSQMSNLKVFPYVLGEYTNKPLQCLLVANDLKDCSKDNQLCIKKAKNNRSRLLETKSTNRIKKREDNSV
jgi:hypothetical protein